MTTTTWKPVGILLVLCLLPTMTGCGTMLNLTGVSTLVNPEVRTASVMGGVQSDGYCLKNPQYSRDPCVSLFVLWDSIFSAVADVALLPLTLSIAAIVGDGPFGPESKSPPPSQDPKKSDVPERRGGKRTH